MAGTTRSRVNFFMNRFRKLGFVRYNGEFEIHSSLLNVVCAAINIRSRTALVIFCHIFFAGEIFLRIGVRGRSFTWVNLGQGPAVSETVFTPSGFDQSAPTGEMWYLKGGNNVLLFQMVMGLDYRRRTVSEDRRRVYGCEGQIFTVSPNGANILSTPSPSSAP